MHELCDHKVMWRRPQKTKFQRDFIFFPVSKIRKASCSMVVPTHTRNFSTLAQLELHSIIFLF